MGAFSLLSSSVIAPMDVVSLTFTGVPLVSSLQVEDFVAAVGAALLDSAGFCANAKVTNNEAHKAAAVDVVLKRNMNTPEIKI